ncbi:MAG TPA: BCCT family transporter, partial [Paracoccaceae bacterium]|nr:BCCT family transporter [Paracoccaceae bacterium]
MTEPTAQNMTPPSVEHEIGEDNIEIQIGPVPLDIHNPVFIIAAASIIIFVIITLVFPVVSTELFGGLRTWLTANFDWFFL